MKFKILHFRRKDDFFDYLVSGEGNWALGDVVPFMQEISNHSKNYKMVTLPRDYDNPTQIQIHNRPAYATINLESTTSLSFKHLIVQDMGIGKQMIDKYVRSIEKN